MIGAHVDGLFAVFLDRLVDEQAERFERIAGSLPRDERVEFLGRREDLRQSVAYFRSVTNAASGSAAVVVGPVQGQSAEAELTVPEVMSVLELKDRQVRYLAERWEVDGLARKRGRSWLIDQVAVDVYREQRSKSA